MDKHIAALRNGEQGLSITLYLDVTPELCEEFHTREAWDVAVLGRSLAEALLSIINASDDIVPLFPRDEAARAIGLFLGCGADRQAWAVPMIEGLYNTRRGLDVPDAMAGYNEDQAKEITNWRDMLHVDPPTLQSRGCPYHQRARTEAEKRTEEWIQDASRHLDEEQGSL
jgi:hypothetical protein